MTEFIDEKLKRISEELDELLGLPSKREIRPDQLIEFGLTYDEAHMWLDYETNFSSKDEQFTRRFLTHPYNRRRLDRTKNHTFFIPRPLLRL
jgi:hypothetical protein